MPNETKGDIWSQENTDARCKQQVQNDLAQYDSLFAKAVTTLPAGVNLDLMLENWGEEWGTFAEFHFVTSRPDKSLSQNISYGLSLPENKLFFAEVLKRLKKAGVAIAEDGVHDEEFSCAKYLIGSNKAKLLRYAA